SATLVVVGAALFLTTSPSGRPSAQDFNWNAGSANGWLLLVALVPMAMFLVEVPIGDFFYRHYYIVGNRGSLVGSLGMQLITVVFVLLGYIAGSASRGLRFSAIALLIPYAVMVLSFGSRRFALIPVLFALGIFLAKNTRATRRGLILGT